VTACVHLARMFAGVFELVELLHGQGVHVGAQTNGFVAGAVFQNTHDACFAQTAVHLEAPVGEQLGDEFGRAQLFKTQLRMRMDVATHSRNAGRLGNERVNNFYSDSLAGEG
jgi:hypothetical protein